jgi:SAM-dependent methyltransferase
MTYGALVDQAAIDPDAFNAFEARGWDEKAAGYDRFFGRITGRLVGPLLDAVSVAPGTRLLDLASGPGYAAAEAVERGASVVGVDVAGAMITLARRLHPGLEFRQADAHELPFDDGSFDAAVANCLILHLGRPDQAMAEFARVLRPGGRLALTAWDLPDRASFLGVFLAAVADAGATPPQDLPTGPDFFRFSVDEEFDALLRRHGLEDRAVTTIAFTHRVATADELWDGFLGGTVRSDRGPARGNSATHPRSLRSARSGISSGRGARASGLRQARQRSQARRRTERRATTPDRRLTPEAQ